MRLVLDTNVVVAALRSPMGASAALLNRAFGGDFTMLISVALVLEYEAVCGQAAQRAVSGLGRDDVKTFITALCRVGEHVNVWFLWRPLLRDPADEMVLEAAINGRADALVTFNWRDFGDEPSRFGVAMLSPQEVLRRI